MAAIFQHNWRWLLTLLGITLALCVSWRWASASTLLVEIDHYSVPIHNSVPADTPIIPWPAARDAALNYSGIHLQRGDVVTVTVTGEGTFSTGAVAHDANGAPINSQTLEGMQSGGYWPTILGQPASAGSVIGTIHALPWAMNDWFLIGTKRVFTATQPGELIFLYHDELYGEWWVGAYADNGGAFIANVQVQRKERSISFWDRIPLPRSRIDLYNYALLAPMLSLVVLGITFVFDWRKRRLQPNPPRLSTQFLLYVCILCAVVAVIVHLLTFPLQVAGYTLQMGGDLATLKEWGLSPRTVAFIIVLPQKITIVVLLVSAFVLMRYQPRDQMALLSALAMITFSQLVADNNDFLRKTYPMVATLPNDLLKGIAHGIALLMAFLLPNGRLFPRWVRYPLALHVGWHLLSTISGYAIWSTQREVVWSTLSAATGLAARQVYLGIWWSLAIVSLVARYFLNSTERERKQLRWLLLGLILGFGGWYLEQGPFLEWHGTTVWVRIVRLLAFHTGIGLFAITLMLAVLRNHLFDIDLIIRRSLMWGALTAFVIGSYVLIVGYLGSLLQTQNNTLLSLVAAGFVAIGFHPLRERLQRVVNRLFYGQRDEPYAVITQLGQRLQATLSPDAVLPTIAQTLQTALKSPYVAVALTQPDGSSLIRATAGEVQPIELTLPLVYNNHEVGQLQIAARQRGELFDAVDQRFVGEFAHAAAAAVHAVRLTDDLQLARQRLVTTREEERRRLRRDLHDGLGPALASISMQTDAARNLLPVTPDSPINLAREMLSDVTTQAQSTMQSVRQLIHGLRPPVLDDLGLIAALRALANTLDVGAMAVTVTAPDQLPPLPAAVEVAVYRICQEALTNVVKHAHATHCDVTLTLAAGALQLVISDNGRGLSDDRRAGVGMFSMRERAEELGGTFAIQTRASEGSEVLLALPLASYTMNNHDLGTGQ